MKTSELCFSQIHRSRNSGDARCSTSATQRTADLPSTQGRGRWNGRSPSEVRKERCLVDPMALLLDEWMDR